MNDDDFIINDNNYVTLTSMGHIHEVQYMSKCNNKANIKKLSKDEYIDLSTGEVKRFCTKENRSESKNSLRQTFKKMRYLINNNFKGHNNELFLTLTYAENMRDCDKLYSDFNKFFKRFRYRYKGQSIDYFNVVEPQERGAWHCHVLVRFNDLRYIYIDSEELAAIWGHGFVKIKRLRDIDNIGAYLSAYLTDLECGEGNEKKYIKGARLVLYPPGIRLYRKSKGIKEPERVKMLYKDAKKIVGFAEPHYKRKIDIDNEDFNNTICYEQYNTKRD